MLKAADGGLPATLRDQPDGGLLDKLIFGVGVGHG
jgi:hypothetical protein